MAKKNGEELSLIRFATRGIRLVSIVVFFGWLMLWIMMPTKTYRKEWNSTIEKETSSTYFGQRQGGNILVFMFPIMFIAVAGSIYVHLQQKKLSYGKKTSGSKNYLRGSWRRPFLVRGPLGIVTFEEVVFLVMFVALVVWYFGMAVHVGFGHAHHIAAKRPEWTMVEIKTMLVSHRLGFAGNVCLAFLFFPVTRGSSILPLFGLTSEASVRYHIWIGHMAMVLLTAHGIGYFIFWGLIGDAKAVIEWAHVGISNVAGELSLLFGIGLWVTTFPKIRRKMFEVFFYTHQLYALFLLFYMMHVSMSLSTCILPGIFLFMIDRYLRFLQSRDRVCLTSARLLPGDTIELNFAKRVECYYAPGSVVFLNVPSVSKLQWHPFTVSSSCGLEPDRLSTIIKKEGSWTRKLHEVLSSSSPPLQNLDVSMEGPYGPTCNHYFLRYSSLVLISGGSGITPFISFIREILHVRRTSSDDSPTPKSIHLICSFRTSADLTMLDLLLPPDLTTSNDDVLLSQLRIDAFVTREHHPATDPPAIRTISFKPRPFDLPVSNALGANSWLWLAAVISSSFVAYLLLLGILYRYYIYPIDHNTNKVFTYAGKAMFNLLFLCVAIAACGGAAVMLNRRWLEKEERDRNRIVSAATPAASPAPWTGTAGTELESFPKESIARAINVKYGGRPNLTGMVLDCKEPNTGVFVSGPSSMNREVSAAVSCETSHNLHLETVSFSW